MMQNFGIDSSPNVNTCDISNNPKLKTYDVAALYRSCPKLAAESRVLAYGTPLTETTTNAMYALRALSSGKETMVAFKATWYCGP